MRPVTFTRYEQLRDSAGRPETRSWQEWMDVLSVHEVKGSPADSTDEATLNAAKDGICYVLGEIPAGAPHENKSVVSVHALGLDLDSITDEELERVAKAVGRWEWLAYTTHKHAAECVGGASKVRIILPLKEPVPAALHKDLWKALDRLTGGKTDRKTKNVGRVFFAPSTYDPAVAWAHRNEGAWLDAAELLSSSAAPADRKLESADSEALMNLLGTGRPNRDEAGNDIVAAARAVSKGEPFAEPGKRHEVALSLTLWLARKSKDKPFSDEAIDEVFGPSYAALAARDGEAPGTEDAINGYHGALEKVTEWDREAKAAKEADAIAEQVTRAGTGAKYDDADLERIADAAGVPHGGTSPAEALRRRWIVQAADAAFYLLAHDGAYRGPFGQGMGRSAAVSILARAPVLLNEPTKNGYRRRSVQELTEDYGTCAVEIVVDLTRQHSAFDEKTCRMYEAARPLRPITPAFDQRIDDWLRTLAGPLYGKLCDWLACAPDLSKLLCAIYIAGHPGAGKCLGLGTLVLMHDGTFKAVEAVRRGDLLMGPDSKPRRVMSTTRGRGELFEIRPTRGAAWVCNDVHVLTLISTDTGKIVDVPLDEYLHERSPSFRERHKQFSVGVEFPLGEQLPLDPYFLGVWFGDGSKHLRKGPNELATVAVSKPDQEIRELCEEVAARYGASVKEYEGGTGCPTYSITTPRGQPNPLLEFMRRIVGPGSAVPRQYLTASRSDRLSFLAGWLDTDGHMNKGGFEIVQKRRDYAEAVAFLARSLGLVARESVKTVNGAEYHRLFISGNCDEIPTRLPRKKAPPRRQAKSATHTGFAVAPLGIGDYAGFEIDGDGRFLLGDFTVTHNTLLAHGVARLWSDTPGDLEKAMSDFNDEIVRCPMLLADETLPRYWKGGSVTTKLRSMLSTHERTLTRKYLPPATLKGALRLIITANNEFLLSTKDTMSGQDLEAVAQRFLYIEAGEAAARLLEATPRETRRAWQEGGIAAHALWLQANRVVEPGKRFWVQGDTTQMHRMLLVSSEWTGKVCDWLSRMLTNPVPFFQSNNGLIRIGGGRLLVNEQAIIDGWSMYFGDTNVEPDTVKIGMALRAISGRDRPNLRWKGDRYRYRDVMVDLVLGWSEGSGIGIRDKMLKTLWGEAGVPEREPGDDTDPNATDDLNTVGAVNEGQEPF